MGGILDAPQIAESSCACYRECLGVVKDHVLAQSIE